MRSSLIFCGAIMTACALALPTNTPRALTPTPDKTETQQAKKGRPLPPIPDKTEPQQKKKGRPQPPIPKVDGTVSEEQPKEKLAASSNIDDHPEHADPDKPLSEGPTDLQRADHVETGSNWKGKKKSKFN